MFRKNVEKTNDAQIFDTVSKKTKPGTGSRKVKVNYCISRNKHSINFDCSLMITLRDNLCTTVDETPF